MVAADVGGRKVEWADVERMPASPSPEARQIELRNAAGQVPGLVVPRITTREGDPDWVKAITPEEVKRRMAEPGYTFEELKKRLGWE